jgi:hypothetical protein
LAGLSLPWRSRRDGRIEGDEDGRTRNVYLGSTRRMNAEGAMQKAREMKAEALECADGMP